MTYIEKLNQLKAEEYLFDGDASWYVTDRTSTCYCASDRPCYHIKIKSEIYTENVKCSFIDRFKPEQCIRFSIPKELFNTL